MNVFRVDFSQGRSTEGQAWFFIFFFDDGKQHMRINIINNKYIYILYHNFKSAVVFGRGVSCVSGGRHSYGLD